MNNSAIKTEVIFIGLGPCHLKQCRSLWFQQRLLNLKNGVKLTQFSSFSRNENRFSQLKLRFATFSFRLWHLKQHWSAGVSLQNKTRFQLWYIQNHTFVSFHSSIYYLSIHVIYKAWITRTRITDITDNKGS